MPESRVAMESRYSDGSSAEFGDVVRIIDEDAVREADEAQLNVDPVTPDPDEVPQARVDEDDEPSPPRRRPGRPSK
ncbi:MAG TPA: hypothetical protein VK988_03075 [Acidimicrobiales bacterium]|nr:hypothetical protein [Acidimicrobiales bacterium]